MDSTKKEVEELLNVQITDQQFSEAYKCAVHKQRYIFQQEKRREVKEHWYLVELIKEYVISLAFQEFTLDLCRMNNMEKEHLPKRTGTPTTNHIVTVSAL
ncbi:MAG: hypothetical protein IJ733_05780 [Lachnospiraceae bacterium]|nr:hypothetical protein [Lachnospiraceae bacterium]